MTLLTTLTRAAGLSLCVVAFAGTALAGNNGNGNGNANPPATPPGQEKKAETPAATAPAPQASSGQEQKAENQAKQAAKAAPKPAAKSKAAKAAKAATPSKGQSANAHHHVIICHRTGSESNPYVVINIPYTAWMHAHSDTTGSHPDKSGRSDKMLKDPASRPGSKDGFTKANCGAAVASPTANLTPTQQNQTAACPATTTTTERVLVGIKHYTGAVKNGQRKYVVISPSQKSAHMNGKHADDEAMYETRSVTRTASGEVCATGAVSSNTTGTANTESTVQASQSVQAGAVAGTQAPVAGVAGAVSPANANANAAAANQDKPAGGVLGAIASAPEAIAETATSGTLPFTGIPLWIAALIGGALLATGLVLRRAT